MSVEQEQTPDISAEEAADFARVGAMVEGAAAPAAEAQEPAPPAPMDAAESMAGFLSIAGLGFDKIAGWKHTGAALTENAEAIAGASVKVLRKYPWGARILAFFESGTGAEEAALVLCLLPLAGAVKADLEAGGEAQQDEPPPARLPAAETKTENAPADLGALVEVHGHADE